MAELLCFGSGSSGNAYAIKCDNETLLLECGLPLKEILKLLNYKINNIVGCLVTHKHQDHLNCTTANKLFQYGIPIYSCQESVDLNKHIKLIKTNEKVNIGGFKIQPIPLQHSCECYGFLIEHKEFGRLVFATDCCEFPYKIKNINHWLIEANYSEECLIDNLCNNEEMRSRHEHHLEFNDTLDALKMNYCDDLQNIVLLHLSNGNSNSAEFVEKVKKELSFDNVFVAERNLLLPLHKEEF